ncbi:unnamed protein product [Paramecium octaurelia]|uniref:Transmembrane protein n=1 Tax=Paramecium octaurelia TaxID=43137 RepID=A0A8S1RTN5_PAROT|nr:unnamed protein product [Paramecium octaurelia]
MSKSRITYYYQKLITQRQLLILRIKYLNQFNILSVLINATKLYMSLAISSSYLKVQTQKVLSQLFAFILFSIGCKQGIFMSNVYIDISGYVKWRSTSIKNQQQS